MHHALHYADAVSVKRMPNALHLCIGGCRPGFLTPPRIYLFMAEISPNGLIVNHAPSIRDTKDATTRPCCLFRHILLPQNPSHLQSWCREPTTLRGINTFGSQFFSRSG